MVPIPPTPIPLKNPVERAPPWFGPDTETHRTAGVRARTKPDVLCWFGLGSWGKTDQRALQSAFLEGFG